MVDQSEPLVSIGLPTLNRADVLPRALDSVLAQTHGNFECVVYDNCSSDQTGAVGLAYAQKDARIRYLRQPRFVSSASNHNAAYHATSGEYFCWFGDDDRWAPTFIESCLRVLRKDRSAVIAAPQFEYCFDDGTEIKLAVWPDMTQMTAIDRARYILTGLDCGAPVLGLMRRQDLERTRLFCNCKQTDTVLLVELALLGSIVAIPQVLYYKAYTGLRHDRRSSPLRGVSWRRIQQSVRYRQQKWRHRRCLLAGIWRSRQLSREEKQDLTRICLRRN